MEHTYGHNTLEPTRQAKRGAQKVQYLQFSYGNTNVREFPRILLILIPLACIQVAIRGGFENLHSLASGSIPGKEGVVRIDTWEASVVMYDACRSASIFDDLQHWLCDPALL